MAKKRIMVVDDDRNTRLLVKDILGKTRKYEISQAANGESCLKKLESTPVDLVLLDIQMPGMDGITTLKQVKRKYPHIAVIMMTAHGSIDRAVECTKVGSFNFLVKPFSPKEKLLITVENALKASQQASEINELRSKLQERESLDNIVGKSPAMQQVFSAVEKIVESEVTVLIQGESGTGKELFAKAIHNLSRIRRAQPFVAVNCTAIPESLLESELFGHEKGAFTGASSRRIGKFESADGGTVFLDEIGDMSLSTQAKILRVLQEREFERLGGNSLVKVNVRLISATNKDLEAHVKADKFRGDLFYRISVYPIKLPPLRERKGDIPLLSENFLKKYRTRENKRIDSIHPDAIKLLMNYHWPGNVRELENAIERAVIVAAGRIIKSEDFPPHILPLKNDSFKYLQEETLPKWIEKLEIDVLRKTLLEFEGNITKAAKKLGIGRATIYRKAKKYNLPISR